MPWRNVAVLFNESHLVDFLEGGGAGADFSQAAFAQGDHAFFAGDALDFRSRTALDDHFADAVGEVQQFADGGAAMIAGAGTFEAAGAFGEDHVGPHGGIEAGFFQLRGGEFLGALAVFANDTHEALGHDAVERGNEIVGFDAHVDEAADDVGDVVGVDGGENQVAGERGLDGDLGGFLVADFADHDFVRIVTEDGTQSASEGEAFFLVDGNLGDAAELVFDGIFNGDDFVFVGLDFVDGGVEGGGLARTGGPGDQDHAVGLANVAAEAAHFVRGKAHDIKAQTLKFFGKRFLVEDAENGVFAVAGGHDGNAQVDEAAFVFDAE